MNKAGFARQFFCITENIHDVTSSQRETVEETTQGQCEADMPHMGWTGSLQLAQLPHQRRPEDPTQHKAQEAKEALPYGIALQAEWRSLGLP